MGKIKKLIAIVMLTAMFAAMPVMAGNETKSGQAKVKMSALKCNFQQKICALKCKKDTNCVAKCDQEKKTCGGESK